MPYLFKCAVDNISEVGLDVPEAVFASGLSLILMCELPSYLVKVFFYLFILLSINCCLVPMFAIGYMNTDFMFFNCPQSFFYFYRMKVWWIWKRKGLIPMFFSSEWLAWRWNEELAWSLLNKLPTSLFCSLFKQHHICSRSDLDSSGQDAGLIHLAQRARLTYNPVR